MTEKEEDAESYKLHTWEISEMEVIGETLKWW